MQVRELEDRTYQVPDSAPDTYYLRLSGVNLEMEVWICQVPAFAPDVSPETFGAYPQNVSLNWK